MKMPFHLPGRRPADAVVVSEKKAAPVTLSALSVSGEARWTGRSYAALSREGFMKNPVAHRAVRLIAEASASMPWQLFDEGALVSDHPLLSLLKRPNGRMSGSDFFEALFGHLLLSGNAYVEPIVVGETLRELHLLRPDRVRIIEGRDGWPEAYEYRIGAHASRYSAEGDGLTVLHMRLFHPLDDHSGLSPLAAAQMALDLHNASSVWNKALLDNSARPSGALVYQPKDGGNLTEEQYERLKQELEEGYAGPMRAGRPLLLEGGLDWKAMGLTPRDMDFTEARNGAARDIALAIGVPPMMLGIPGDNTYSNYQEANRAFYRLTVLPLIARTAAALTTWLAPVYGAALTLEVDLDQVSALSAERDALWARVSGADFLSDEEKREAVGY
ncbi:phage portal protein [Martelella soudanensis]|uniref:phage portal protein n=1 Tax=unclassified Martelella TaxID=2629616 RepID=UPI0015DFC65E|nr:MULTISPECIES: phage portal protein [unclassified Martelella]